ncbi:MAG: universal stress protein [Pseudomonadota bacterium]
MFKHLLLAVDVNAPDSASRSTEAAVSMARAHGAVLHLLNVVPDQGMPIVSASLDKDHTAHMIELAENALKAWAKAHVPEDVDRKLHVAEGTVYDQIIKVSDRLKIDVIVVGAHRPELRDYLMGPNAARVARHANQSVFVVR